MKWKKALLLDVVLTILYVTVIDMAVTAQPNSSFPNLVLKAPDGTIEHINFWVQIGSALVVFSILVFAIWGACIAVKSAWVGMRGKNSEI